MANSRPIVGRATLTEDPRKGVMKALSVATNSATCLPWAPSAVAAIYRPSAAAPTVSP